MDDLIKVSYSIPALFFCITECNFAPAVITNANAIITGKNFRDTSIASIIESFATANVVMFSCVSTVKHAKDDRLIFLIIFNDNIKLSPLLTWLPTIFAQ